MYTATVPIQINSFAPLAPGGPTIAATLSPPTVTSITPGGAITSPSTGSILISVPASYVGSVQLTFQLPDPAYVLLGIAVNPTQTSGGVSVGRQEFRTITINRDPSGSQMTVTDACLPTFGKVNFDYVILVQRVSDGAIGIIDPDIETEGNEN